jgi:hypothetical protein
MHNILVHEGKQSAVLDWECTSAVPAWIFHSIPKFCYGQLRRHFDRYDYGEDAENDPDSLFSEHRIEYEQTLLRDVFKDVGIQTAWLRWTFPLSLTASSLAHVYMYTCIMRFP